MRPVCLGPLSDFHPIDWWDTTCAISASQRISLPSISTVQRVVFPARSTLFTKLIHCGKRSRFDHASKTVSTGRPTFTLFSRRSARTGAIPLRRFTASALAAAAKTPVTVPAKKPGQKLLRPITAPLSFFGIGVSSQAGRLPICAPVDFRAADLIFIPPVSLCFSALINRKDIFSTGYPRNLFALLLHGFCSSAILLAHEREMFNDRNASIVIEGRALREHVRT